MTNWDKPFVFERTSNIYTFSKNPLHQKNNNFHLYIPWSVSIENELMFKIKNQISSKGKCLIPFMGKQFENENISNEEFENILMQISLGVETHLVMSNLDSIHIFKVNNLIKTKENQMDNGDTIELFKTNNSNFEFWIEVNDLFVFKANHGENESIIKDELENLVFNQITQTFFTPIQNFKIQNKVDEKASALKWVEVNRNLTYDYFIRSCELEENIFQEAWLDLSRRSQHCLILSEQVRHKGVLYKNDEKLIVLKESFEAYVSGVLNELNEIYISPLVNAFMEYSSLQEAWQDIQTGLVNPDLKKLLQKMYSTKQKQLESIEEFLIYVNTIKTCLFSFKNRFTKKIGKEEYLLIENFLTRQEALIESFNSRGLDTKLKNILEVKNWLGSVVNNLDSLSSRDQKNAALKLTHILSIISGSSYEDNIFFKLIEEKTSKGIQKRSFEDEVKSLNKLCTLALAS